jgi:hypothetical protein
VGTLAVSFRNCNLRKNKMKEYLDNCLEKYFIQILNRNEFKLIDSEFFGLGGIYRFENSDLKFNIINDRGIIETSISSIYSEYFFDFELVNFYLFKQTKSEILKPKFGENILSKRLNLEEISSLFEKELDYINFIFSKTEYLKTETELLKIGAERAKLLFGNI